MPGSHLQSLRTVVPALVWFLLGTSSCLAIARLEPNMLEEGMILHIAQRLAGGESLYRDIVAFTGPFPYELLALLFRIFGEEILVGRVAVALLHGGATASAYLLARRAGVGPFAHLAGAVLAATPFLLFPLHSIYYYTTLCCSISLIAVWQADRSVDSERSAIAAGVLVAIAALCKQTTGAVLAVGLLLAIFACARPEERWKRTGAYCAGGLAVALATLGGFAAVGSLDALYFNVVILPLALDDTYSAPFINLWPPGEFSRVVRNSQNFYLPYFFSLSQGLFAQPGVLMKLATQALYALPLVAFALSLIKRFRTPLPTAAWMHLAMLAAWIVNLFPRTDWGHLVHVLPAAAVQLVLLAPAFRGAPILRRGAVWATTAAGVLALSGGALWSGQLVFGLAGEANYGPRVPLRPVSPGMRGTGPARAIRYLRENAEPGEAIFVPRAEPLIYFATDTHNPTPYSGIVPHMRDEQEKVILEALEEVRFVVMSDIDQPAMTFYRDELPNVQAYLERYFRKPEKFKNRKGHWISVLERRDDAGETLIDLIREKDRVQHWIRDRYGNELPVLAVQDRIATKYNRRPHGFMLGETGGGFDIEIDVPADAEFHVDIGVLVVAGQRDLFLHPRPALIRLAVGKNGRFLPLVAEHSNKIYAHGWMPLVADLRPYEGQRITLRVEMLTTRKALTRQVGYVGSPRVVRPAEPEEEAAP